MNELKEIYNLFFLIRPKNLLRDNFLRIQPVEKYYT